MRFLIEKFSPSMPKWVQSELIVNSYNRYTNRPQGDPQRDLKVAPFEFGPRTYDGVFLNKGLFLKKLDPNKMKFLGDGSIPTKSTDPRLKDPYIPFFCLPLNGGTRQIVYAKGINDKQWYEDKRLECYSLKQLLRLATAFNYIDSSDQNNYFTDLADERDAIFKNMDMSYERVNSPTYPRIEKPFTSYLRGNLFNIPNALASSRYHANSTSYSIDASGYPINPDKYKDKLAEYKAQNYKKYFDEIYKEIKTLQIALNAAMYDYPISTGQRVSDDFYTFYRTAFSKLGHVINTYNDSLASIVEGTGDMTRIFRYQLPSAKRSIKELNDDLAAYLVDYVNFED